MCNVAIFFWFFDKNNFFDKNKFLFERQQKRRPYCANAQQITLSLFSHCFTFLKKNYFLHLYILYLFLLIMSCSICVHITQFLYYIFHLFQVFLKKQAFWEFNCAKWGNDSLSSLARRAWWKMQQGMDREKCSRQS